MTLDLVIYHGGCFDGFCAAWIAHKLYPDAKYLPYHYGMEPPDVTGKGVLIIDFSFKRDILLAMRDKSALLEVLDHHKTAQEDLKGLDFCVFNMNKSGGRLTWEWLFPYQASPWLVDYTEDRDLWLHKLPMTKEINAGLRCQPMEFKHWDMMAKMDPFCEIRMQGEGILSYQKKLIDSHVNHAGEIELDGHKVSE